MHTRHDPVRLGIAHPRYLIDRRLAHLGDHGRQTVGSLFNRFEALTDQAAGMEHDQVVVWWGLEDAIPKMPDESF